jgi:hypothetical protein
MAIQNPVFTHTLVNGIISIQQGAKQIYLKNTGGASATYTGNKANGVQPSTPVTLGVAEDFEFESNGGGYGEVVIDASTTTVEIVAIY